MIVLGIDCGLTGAIAGLRSDGSYIDVFDLPVVRRGAAKWIDGRELRLLVRKMRGEDSAHAIVEHIHAMPEMGSVANNSKGMTLGSTLTCLDMCGCSIELVSPVKWKRAQGLLMPEAADDEKKQASLKRARQLFPRAPLERVADHGRAESLLIADWYARAQRSAATWVETT